MSRNGSRVAQNVPDTTAPVAPSFEQQQQSPSRKFDHQIDRRREEQNHASAAYEAYLLLIGGRAAAVEHGMRPNQGYQSNDCWDRNVNIGHHFFPPSAFSEAFGCNLPPLPAPSLTMNRKLATSGKIRALGTLRLMREVAISAPRTAFGPTLPSSPSAQDGSYRRISRCPRHYGATAEFDPQRKWTRTSAIRLFRFSASHKSFSGRQFQENISMGTRWASHPLIYLRAR
jgi:hypothetical protein